MRIIDKSWKQWEREVAAKLGGKRTGPLGSNVPDITGIPIAVECKYQKRLSLRRGDILQAIKNAGDNDWALALKERGGEFKLVVVDLKYFKELYDKAYKAA